jgi:hypothetical protein
MNVEQTRTLKQLIAFAAVIFVCVIGNGKLHAATPTEAAQTDIRSLYLELEDFLETGKLTAREWTFSEENKAWSAKLHVLLEKTRTDASIAAPVKEAAEAMRRLYAGISLSRGRFREIQETNLKMVLDGIRTGPADTIGDALLQVAAQHRAEENPEAEAKAREESRALMAEHTAAAQNELRPLFDDLQRMRNNREFHEFGFSPVRHFAADWLAKAQALRDKINQDQNIPLEVRVSPMELIHLAVEWQHSKGAMTDRANLCLERINDALNWKLPE